MTARCKCWPTEEKYHFVYYGATEPGSAWEYNPYCPEHGDKRWKIACINWPHRETPHFIAYVLVDGEMKFDRYSYTFAEAVAYIGRFGPRIDESLASRVSTKEEHHDHK